MIHIVFVSKDLSNLKMTKNYNYNKTRRLKRCKLVIITISRFLECCEWLFGKYYGVTLLFFVG